MHHIFFEVGLSGLDSKSAVTPAELKQLMKPTADKALKACRERNPGLSAEQLRCIMDAKTPHDLADLRSCPAIADGTPLWFYVPGPGWKRCSPAADHLTAVIVSHLRANQPGVAISDDDVRSIRDPINHPCLNEGLSAEQLSCVMQVETIDDFEQLGSCPAMRADPPSWLPGPGWRKTLLPSKP